MYRQTFVYKQFFKLEKYSYAAISPVLVLILWTPYLFFKIKCYLLYEVLAGISVMQN